MRYLVFDIGCLECGEESGIVGFFNSIEEASQAADRAAVNQGKNWIGQHSFQVFDTEDQTDWSVFREELND